MPNLGHLTLTFEHSNRILTPQAILNVQIIEHTSFEARAGEGIMAKTSE